MRAVALLALGRWERARQACGVQYQAPAAVVAAPWRTWVGLQACYLGGNLEVSEQGWAGAGLRAWQCLEEGAWAVDAATDRTGGAVCCALRAPLPRGAQKAGQLGASLAEALRAPAAGGEREARARELRSLGGDSAAVLRGERQQVAAVARRSVRAAPVRRWQRTPCRVVLKHGVRAWSRGVWARQAGCVLMLRVRACLCVASQRWACAFRR